MYDEKTNDVLIAFIGYVNDLNKLQQFKVSVQKSHFSTLVATVRVALLRSSWCSCFMRAALFIIRETNSSLVFSFPLQTSLFIHPHRKNLICMCQIQTAVSSHQLKIGHVYMNIFTRNSPYCQLLKYLLFLLKHPVYMHT